jgi:hypothetical protein
MVQINKVISLPGSQKYKSFLYYHPHYQAHWQIVKNTGSHRAYLRQHIEQDDPTRELSAKDLPYTSCQKQKLPSGHITDLKTQYGPLRTPEFPSTATTVQWKVLEGHNVGSRGRAFSQFESERIVPLP